MKITTVHPLGSLSDYKFVVVMARHAGGLLLCRKKGRDTWETPGGHIEAGERPVDAAKRELWEETGAREFRVRPGFDYYCADDLGWANGQVLIADVAQMGDLPEEFEMEEVREFSALPENMSYPHILPVLWAEFERLFGRDTNGPGRQDDTGTH